VKPGCFRKEVNKDWSSINEIFKTFIRITKLDREINQSVREKLGVQNIVLKMRQYCKEGGP
jgi:hypothetical protein